MKIGAVLPKKPLSDDLVELKFKFSIIKMPTEDTEDSDFPYPDELFFVNFGETGKFTSKFVYQSRFTVLRDGDGLNFNGYAPDFARKSNIIKTKDGGKRFELNTEYSVKLLLSKYRVYIDVDNGFAKTSYGNGRDEITDVAFYSRKGVEVTLSEIELKGFELPNIEIDGVLKYFIDNGLITNYRDYHLAHDGVYFDRISIEQNLDCTTRNSGAYQSGVAVDVYTNAREMSLQFLVSDIPCETWECQFGFYVNGKRILKDIFIVEKDKSYTETFKIDENCPKYNRITIFFPYSVSMALQKITATKNAEFKPANKNGWMYFYGDSITEGSECFNPSSVYVTQVCMAYNYNCLDQAISGRSFNAYNVKGGYFHQPSYVFIANGTNHFCAGMGEKEKVFDDLEKNMRIVLNLAKKEFPSAKIIALLPIWRSDESGINFSLSETVEKMKEIYAEYPEVSVIDCHSFVPFDDSYFSSSELAIHPNSKGHDEYAKNLLNALEKVIGKPEKRDDQLLAEQAFTN